MPKKGVVLDDRNQLSTEVVRIFLPNAWAKIDVETSNKFDAIYNIQQEAFQSVGNLQKSMIVYQRDLVIDVINQLPGLFGAM